MYGFFTPLFYLKPCKMADLLQQSTPQNLGMDSLLPLKQLHSFEVFQPSPSPNHYSLLTFLHFQRLVVCYQHSFLLDV
ncbi:hypothetical protein GIB67_015807, partial [Kingdonia uniflora]